jgi:hypothetical protein
MTIFALSTRSIVSAVARKNAQKEIFSFGVSDEVWFAERS